MNQQICMNESSIPPGYTVICRSHTGMILCVGPSASYVAQQKVTDESMKVLCNSIGLYIRDLRDEGRYYAVGGVVACVVGVIIVLPCCFVWWLQTIVKK